MAGEYVPGGTAAKWLAEEWSPSLALAAFEEARIYPLYMDVGNIPYKYHYPRHLGVVAAQLAEATAGSALSATSNTETEAVITCTTQYVMIEVNHNVLSRMAGDPHDTLRQSVEKAVAARIDALSSADAATLAAGVTTASLGVLTYADVRWAQYAMALNAKEWYTTANDGKGNPALIIHPAALHAITTTAAGNIMEYQIRGDGTSPVVRGYVGRLLGFDVIETGSVGTDGTDHYNMALIPNKTFIIGFSHKPSVKVEEYELADRIICWTDFGTKVLWDTAGVWIKTIDDAVAAP